MLPTFRVFAGHAMYARQRTTTSTPPAEAEGCRTGKDDFFLEMIKILINFFLVVQIRNIFFAYRATKKIEKMPFWQVEG
jgi:hypothetical protein